MVFQPISQLFAGRDVRLEKADIQHGIESFLQQELRLEHVHCSLVGASLRLDIRVGSAAVAEAILVRERYIRSYAASHLQCSLGDFRVMLDL